MRITFDSSVDGLTFVLSDAPVARTVEVGNGLLVDLDEHGAVVAIEILGASERLSSMILPSWVPDGAVVRVWARQNAGHGWETLIPEFSIAGMGRSLDEAIENAIELLDDYLVLCQRDGMSFDESRRPLPVATMAQLVAEFAIGRVFTRLGQGKSGRKRLDLPLHHALAH